MVEELQRKLHSPGAAATETREHLVESNEVSVSAGARISSANAGLSKAAAREAGAEVTKSYKTSKEEFLQRSILTYQQKFRSFAELSDGDSYLFLDDLYHIRRSDQARVLDYFHRISKNGRLWIKSGSIKHRTNWYKHGDPPIGMKIGDDADDVDLDVTLERYELAKKFLLRILNGFLSDCSDELRPGDILTDGAIDRLVLASGGVARDFLGILRRSISIARERAGGPRGERIGAEDVNAASGEYDASKREELSRDALEDQARLEAEFQKIRSFCIDEAAANVFLLPKDGEEEIRDLVNELVDLRLLHKIRSRVTVKSGRPGEIFEAYMLDVSQYTASRKVRDLQIIEFWRSDGEDALRRATLVYPPRSDVMAS